MEKQKLENFKKIVLKAMNPKSNVEIEMFDLIPDEVHQNIFENNFNGNYALARKIILNKFDQDDYKKIEKEKLKINDMTKAASHIAKMTLEKDTPVLFLTDTDNDGSLAQANILAFEKALPSEVKNRFNTLYCQQVNGNTTRGFTVDLVDLWMEKNPQFKDSEFTIVTADNGINSREEQEKINEKYPNAKLIVTDHHNPDEESVVVPNDKTMVVNPKFKANKYFQEKNISGANVLGVLLEQVLENYSKDPEMEVLMTHKAKSIEHMRDISRAANLLDYVDTDISDKPLKDHLVEKYSTIGALMNVNNSLNKIITTEMSNDEIKELFSDVEGLDFDELLGAIKGIKEQNLMAEKLLTLQKRFEALNPEMKIVLSKDRIFEDMIVELDKNAIDEENINPNFVEQLRPFIFNYSTSPELLDYEKGIMEEMTNVYSKLKKEERRIQTVLGQVDLMNVDKLDNTTIMYPKNGNHLSLLNRKLLGKVYNEENNGFLMILDSVGKEKASGSFRSIYRIQNILENKSRIEKMFNIKLSFQGHDKAAGFFIEKQDGTELKPEVISATNKFINESLSVLKEKDKRSYSHLIHTDFDFETINVFNKYNKAVKGSLTNMQSLSPVVQFNKSTYLTNNNTLVDENLQEIVKNKRYGYVPANISFDNKTIILPTEMLRQIVNSNFKDGIQVSFMNDGAFIGNKLIPNVNQQNLHKIKSKSSKREKIIDFYQENYEGKNFIDLPIKHLKDSPFFSANRFGESEYKRFESMVMKVIDQSGVDMIVVADTEANGLGNAPKIANLGVVELSIDEKSGSKLKGETFKTAAFKSVTGKRYLLSKAQIKALKPVSRKDYFHLSFKEKQNVVVNLENKLEMFISSDLSEYKKLYDYKVVGDSVIVNRELKSNIGAVFIKDRDMKISEKIKTLTAIDNTMLNKIGISSKEADKLFTDRYKGKKCIFQAHNLPYDLGVIKANLGNFYDVMTDFDAGNYLSDSAIYSEEQKLAYDPVNIATFEKEVVPSLNLIQFFHSEASDMSLKSFLSTEEDGLLPDRTDRFILKKKGGLVSVIDTKENTEISVEVARTEIKEKLEERAELREAMGRPAFEDGELTADDVVNMSTIKLLEKHIVVADMPKNAIKYAVQALSDYDMIRAMILSGSKFEIKPAVIPPVFENSKDKLEFFMMNYHFDAGFGENFRNFGSTLDAEEYSDLFVTKGFKEEEALKLEKEWLEEKAITNHRKRKPNFKNQVGADPKVTAFEEFAHEFLMENKELQSKFHEVWVYKKVLNTINPTKAKLKDKDIVDVVARSTSLPVEKVVSIMEEAIEYKEKYGLENVIQKEPHNNVFFDECDVVMESILTFKRPTDRNYNSYNHSMENVVEMYLKNIVKTSSQHMVSQTRNMALDSYSRTQALSYKRGEKSDYIKNNQAINENVKFKFGATTLQQDQFAYGVLKKEIEESEVPDISKKLEFIVKHEQMRFSIDEKKYSPEREPFKAAMDSILKANDAQVTEYKAEMVDYFEEVFFSKKESNMKKCLELVKNSILDGKSINVPRNMESLMKREKNLLVHLTEKFSKLAVSLGVSELDEFNLEELTLNQANKVNNPEDGEVAKDHSLMNFLSGIPEKSEEELKESYDEKLERLLVSVSGDEASITKALNDQTIIETVKIKRKDDAKKFFEFGEVMSNRLQEVSAIKEVNKQHLKESQKQKRKATSRKINNV